jgi:hypothetical protein
MINSAGRDTSVRFIYTFCSVNTGCSIYRILGKELSRKLNAQHIVIRLQFNFHCFTDESQIATVPAE